MQSYVKQSMYLTSFLVGCYNQDSLLIKSALKDIIIEPQRSKLIPDFEKIKKLAQQNNVLGFSISGAGPSMFAWCSSIDDAEKIENSITNSVDNFSHKMDVWITKIDSRGAYIMEDGNL